MLQVWGKGGTICPISWICCLFLLKFGIGLHGICVLFWQQFIKCNDSYIVKKCKASYFVFLKSLLLLLLLSSNMLYFCLFNRNKLTWCFSLLRMPYDSKDLYGKLRYSTIYAMSLGTFKTYLRYPVLSLSNLHFDYRYMEIFNAQIPSYFRIEILDLNLRFLILCSCTSYWFFQKPCVGFEYYIFQYVW